MKRIKVEGYMGCPVCGSSDIKRVGFSIAKTDDYQCKGCGWLFDIGQAKVAITRVSGGSQ